MLTDTHTGLDFPQGTWWKPAHKSEKVWVAIAFVWCMVLFAMMPLWHWKGGQNPSGIRRTTTPADFMARVTEFTNQYKVGEDRGLPIVAPPPGADVYLVAYSFQWSPILKLQKNVEYTLHLSSLDVNHGFSLYPINVNFQVVPGYDYGLRVTPNAAGDFRIICNEFCGIGHHIMVGRVMVDDAPSVASLGGVR
ncbi:MAG: cytochrome c oxidase subunit II [Acidobacteria bacterium]|nr:cytochrome c oxidase subunit II [Acidobacteriota bacterium]